MPKVLTSLEMQSGTVLPYQDGSASAPSLTFASDLNTGLYRIGADIIGFSAGGAERARVTTSGVEIIGNLSVNVGAGGGPSSFGHRLQAKNFNLLAPSAANNGLGANADDNTVSLYSGATEKVRLLSGGGEGVSIGEKLSLAAIGTAPDARLFVKDHSAFSGSAYRVTTAAVRTTDATATAIKTIGLADNTTYIFDVMVVGREATNNRAGYFTKAVVYREGGGAATIQDTESQDFVTESNAAWNASIVVSGNNVEVQVTGVAATTIDWAATIKYQAVSTNA